MVKNHNRILVLRICSAEALCFLGVAIIALLTFKDTKVLPVQANKNDRHQFQPDLTQLMQVRVIVVNGITNQYHMGM